MCGFHNEYCSWHPTKTFDNRHLFCVNEQILSICVFNIIDCVWFEVITQEKTIHNIEVFDKHKLKHTETEVKNPLPDKKSE